MLNKAVDLDTFGLKWNWIEWFGKPIFATIFATASQIFATTSQNFATRYTLL